MRLVVVGGVAAGLSAASRARRMDKSLEIVVLEKGGRISYGACGLPYFIEGQVESVGQLTVMTPDVFERDRDIRIRLNAEVVAIQHSRREVVLAGGERMHYDQLVWGAGAVPQRWNDPRAFSFHTDADAERLQDFLQSGRRRTAAVVGGGYIGLELATALRARGLAVTVFEARSHLLHWEDVELTNALLKRLEECRIAVYFNRAVKSVEETGCDLAIIATGLKPNVAVPAEAGVELGRTGAIRTDDRTQTNLHGLYAAGDCAESRHLVTGRPVWVPLGPLANKMGRVAGANAAGHRETFAGVVGTSIVRVGGLGVAMTGLSQEQAKREGFVPARVRIEALNKPRYFRGRPIAVELIADRNSHRLIGGSVAGDEDVAGRINVIATAVSAGMKADDFAVLDLAYAPPFATVMDPLLIAGQQLVKLLH